MRSVMTTLFGKVTSFWGGVGRLVMFITYSVFVGYNLFWLILDLGSFVVLKNVKFWLRLGDRIACAVCSKGSRRALNKNLKVALDESKTYGEWEQIAAELDEVNGNTLWRSTAEGTEYDFEILRRVIKELRANREGGETSDLCFTLRTCLHRSFAGLNNKDLFSNSNLGTKHLVEEFNEEVIRSLGYLCDDVEYSDPEGAQVTKFYYHLTQSYGRCALCLSGGGSLTMYHMGTVKCLIEQGCMPTVVSGTSGGSVVAAMCALHTDETLLKTYIRPDISTRLGVQWFEPFSAQIANFLGTGYLADPNAFKRCVRAYFGEATFGEAFEVTGRVVNISVTTRTASGSTALLLNYLSSPSVLLWSAVMSSCALPGLLPPQQLMAKNERGDIVPYSPGQVFADGSIHADLPMQRLAELFNVNYFIVAQVNPHVNPFIRAHTRPGRNGNKGGGALREIEYMLNIDVQQRMRKLAKLGLIPRVYGNDIAPVFMQRYVGNVTIAPRMSLWDNFRAIQQPSFMDMKRYIEFGQRAAWPRLAIIKHAMTIETKLRECSRRWPHLMGPRASVAMATSRRLEAAMNRASNQEAVTPKNDQSPPTIMEQADDEEAFPSLFDRRTPWAKAAEEQVVGERTLKKQRSFSHNSLSNLARR